VRHTPPPDGTTGRLSLSIGKPAQLARLPGDDRELRLECATSSGRTARRQVGDDLTQQAEPAFGCAPGFHECPRSEVAGRPRARRSSTAACRR